MEEGKMKAFPSTGFRYFKDGVATAQDGMELRDYFAAKAMPLAMEWVKQTYDRELKEWLWHGDDAEEIATVAYLMADVMMEVRGHNEPR